MANAFPQILHFGEKLIELIWLFAQGISASLGKGNKLIVTAVRIDGDGGLGWSTWFQVRLSDSIYLSTPNLPELDTCVVMGECTMVEYMIALMMSMHMQCHIDAFTDASSTS